MANLISMLMPIAVLLLTAVACGEGGASAGVGDGGSGDTASSDGDGDSDADTDSDSDADADGDTDSDTDSDSDTDTDADGECDQGTTETSWATQCPNAAEPCTAGTWVAGGPDPDHGEFALIGESDHFAVYSDESVSSTTVSQALSTLEDTVWATYFGDPIYFTEPLCDQETKYKCSVHIHSGWGLTGGAFASDRTCPAARWAVLR